MLARYRDSSGRLREVLARPGSGGSVLVVDRDAATRRDNRLIAHLGADEPPRNAHLACEDYLRHPSRLRCRALTAEDLRTAPIAGFETYALAPERQPAETVDRHGNRYRLAPVVEGLAIPELRWRRVSAPQAALDDEERELELGAPLSLRQVIAALEDYEPVRGISADAVARNRQDRRVSVATLRSELERVDTSSIVLNRALREAVCAALARGASMSEIALRCGHPKRDARRAVHGDTSWLARRVGLLPSPGRSEPTPWVHSDVLALIARDGLDLSPREVELG